MVRKIENILNLFKIKFVDAKFYKKMLTNKIKYGLQTVFSLQIKNKNKAVNYLHCEKDNFITSSHFIMHAIFDGHRCC